MKKRAEKGGLLFDYKTIFRECENLNVIQKVTRDIDKGLRFTALVCFENRHCYF